MFNFLKRRNKKKQTTTVDELNWTECLIMPPKLSEASLDEHETQQEVYTPKRKGELSEVSQTIWTYAPDSYHEMYWPTPIRPTMETDFEELRRGIEYVFRQKRFNESRPALLELVEAAYDAYKSGDREQGMELISQVQIAYGKMK